MEASSISDAPPPPPPPPPSQARSQSRTHRSDLFLFDTRTLQGDILLHQGSSRLEYHEYAVFRLPVPTDQDKPGPPPATKHVSHRILSEETSGERLLHLALREDHALDSKGRFKAQTAPDESLEGKVRQIICRRRVRSDDGSRDGLSITDDDFELLRLHPATLQYVRRTTSESMFWDRRHEKLSLVLSFSADPRAPFDFLSMTYSIPDQTTTAFIRQSFDPYHHAVDELDEYGERMEACKSHWSHPLITPVVLLQAQFARTEEAIAENNMEVNVVEADVSNMAGFLAYEGRSRGRLSFSRGPNPLGPQGMPKKTTELMKNAHDVLKRSIRLLDTIRWMERAVKILVDAGDALDTVMQDDDDTGPPLDVPVPLSARGRVGTTLLRARILENPMSSHWHEIRQYLEGLLQLCMALGTERVMLELRCKAQIDIIYSKMAQEDNNLNARMAVASSRDSSSMKALAVITAIFLPGEFIGTLFGISMFDWQDIDTADDNSSASNSTTGDKHPIVSSRFWVYWATTLPLTIVILCFWRGWWVWQDRYFRKHLSKELSEERYWTDNGQPRDLTSSFIHDFFYLSVRRGEGGSGDRMGTISASTTLSKSSAENGTFDKSNKTGRISTITQSEYEGNGGEPQRTFRLRQIAFANPDRKRSGRVMV